MPVSASERELPAERKPPAVSLKLVLSLLSGAGGAATGWKPSLTTDVEPLLAGARVMRLAGGGAGGGGGGGGTGAAAGSAAGAGSCPSAAGAIHNPARRIRRIKVDDRREGSARDTRNLVSQRVTHPQRRACPTDVAAAGTGH